MGKMPHTPDFPPSSWGKSSTKNFSRSERVRKDMAAAMCWAGLSGEQKINLLASELRADRPPLAASSMTRFLPELQ